MDGNTASSDFVLQWGNGKRLRCRKFQSNSKESSIDRGVIRSDLKNHNNIQNPNTLRCAAARKSHGSNGYLNLRHRVFRNSEGSISMRAHINGAKALVSPDRGDKKGGTANNNSNINNNHHQNDNHHHHGSGSGGSGSSETAQEGKKGGTALSGSQGGINAVWPPKFLIALTNKEKEEDFMAIKGSKLPQRPKKRAKFIQRTVNLVCPGSWLCDLTLERYEVREKKVSKKRPRGLKAMGNMYSESE